MAKEKINRMLNEFFPGKVVRKDLTKLVKGNAIVPTYVLEYLLGQYCATDDEETINAGVESVRSIISKHFVHRDEAEYIKSKIKEKGNHRLIDKISVRLNERRGVYEASFTNLAIRKVEVDTLTVQRHKKLLSTGVWCIANLSYFLTEDREVSPWILESIKPIQLSNSSIEEYKQQRKNFDKEEWIDALMQSIGLNPEEFSHRSKLLQLARLVPFAENNYNLIELGPKGTGKSHIYSELSPHGMLISGGEVTKAKLFINNASGELGLVGYWDVVAYDEFAGKEKRVDKGMVDIMKNYMANRNFSRGTEVFGAAASMVFVGNTDRSVPYMLRHSNLFEALPKGYYDTAFLDRLHAYLPGWEVSKLRNEMFTDGYGFIVDYLAEVLKELRREDYAQHYKQFFQLSDTITTRDRDAIAKTYSGLFKVVYPHGECDEQGAKELLEFAIEARKRVKEQLLAMDETFEEVDFSYVHLSSQSKNSVTTLERQGAYPNEGIRENSTRSNEGQAHSLASGVTKQELPKYSQKVIVDNQRGISFDQLFGDYVDGAKRVVVTDPYIRLHYQMRNFMEFAMVVAKTKEEGEEVYLHLVTASQEPYIDNAKEMFSEMANSLWELGVRFSFEFKDASILHDRSIQIDDEWQIALGRGLDLFQKTNGRFDVAEYDQNLRRCKSCNIIYLRKE